MGETVYFIDVLTDEERRVLIEALGLYWHRCDDEIRQDHNYYGVTSEMKLIVNERLHRTKAVIEELERRCRA